MTDLHDIQAEAIRRAHLISKLPIEKRRMALRHLILQMRLHINKHSIVFGMFRRMSQAAYPERSKC